MIGDDLEGTFDCLKVEVSVTAGKNSGVNLTTMIDIPRFDHAKAVLELRAVIKILRAALPVAELKGEDQAYESRDTGLGLDSEGNVKAVPANLRETRQAQELLKRAMSDERAESGPGQLPETKT
jgi:hypothetical protein